MEKIGEMAMVMAAEAKLIEQNKTYEEELIRKLSTENEVCYSFSCFEYNYLVLYKKNVNLLVCCYFRV